MDLRSAIMVHDHIFTGEGSFDNQTLQGKAVAQIIDLSLELGKDVTVVCGVNTAN